MAKKRKAKFRVGQVVYDKALDCFVRVSWRRYDAKEDVVHLPGWWYGSGFDRASHSEEDLRQLTAREKGVRRG